MKKVLFTLGVLLTMGFGATAQVVADDVVDIETNDVKLEVITPAEQVKESKKEIKEREKKMREMNDEVAHAKATNSLRRGYFVLVADNIQIGNTGYRRYDINSNSNFVLVQDEDGILQYAISQRTPGPNGLGGYTGKGKVRNKKITYADNGEVYMQYDLSGATVHATVHITLYPKSNRAVADIMGGRRITMYGEILPYRDKDHR